MRDINGIEDLSQQGRELALYIENERLVYDGYYVPIARSLQRKWKADTWDTDTTYPVHKFSLDLAIKSMLRYVVLPAAKHHHMRHGSMSESWQQAFPLSDRRDVAEYLMRYLIAEWRIGNEVV